MKKTAAVLILMLIASFVYASSFEDIQAKAKAALDASDTVAAVDIYYEALNDKGLKGKDRAAVTGALGKLLCDTERYEEAERVLSALVSGQGTLASAEAYETLLQIYVQAIPDSVKAEKLRNAYAKRFGRTPTLRKIDTTLKVMGTDYNAGAEVLKLPVKDIAILKYYETRDFDREFFPVRNYISRHALSPDKKKEIVRQRVNGKSMLYVKHLLDNSQSVISGSTNGFAAQWSWNGRSILFSALNSAGERSLKIYDTGTKKVRTLFSGSGMETLACLSPDGTKVFFVYRRAPWVMSADGSVISLMNKDVRIKEPLMAAWSKDGGRILVITGNAPDYVFTVYELGKKTVKLPGRIDGGKAIIR